MKPIDERNNGNEHSMVKKPNWCEADQLAIYKHDRGVGLGSAESQHQFSGQSATWTGDLGISSSAPQPLDHAASTECCFCIRFHTQVLSNVLNVLSP